MLSTTVWIRPAAQAVHLVRRRLAGHLAVGALAPGAGSRVTAIAGCDPSAASISPSPVRSLPRP
jgi:hypothetical protein